MNSLQRISTVIAAVLIAVSASADAMGDRYVAYSLRRAEELIRDGRVSPSGLKTLGGITEPIAVVHDAEGKDFIIVGRVQSSDEGVGLDDFVVALRSMFKYETWPMVSIDKTKTTETTGKQEVRFLGGIAGTPFGMALFRADVLLKQIALGELAAETWGVRSYFDRRCDQAKKTDTRGRVRTRFWFTRDKHASSFVHSSGACGVERFKLRVQTHVVDNLADKAGRSVSDDRVGEEFAEAFSVCYDDLSEEFRILIRVKRLFEVLGLASGLRVMQERYQLFQPEELAYWLDEYRVSSAQTPRNYPLIEKERVLDHKGKSVKVELDGGIELKHLVLELTDGTIDALRDIVVKLRPDPSALTWEIPLHECGIRWDANGMEYTDLSNSVLFGVKSGPGTLGCTLDGRIFEHTSADLSRTLSRPDSDDASFANFPALTSGMPAVNESSRLSPLHTSTDIGGVMLSGAAKVEGTDEVQVNLAGGNFSLVVDGKNARIDPKMYRKFITALWCVYYCDQDPGISIDPIGRESEKHLVRYIGRVINTDLARVMRKADYIMKKWAVGTERPDYPGFHAVDGWMARYGAVKSGVSRRFWFVPEELSFKRGGDLLLFGSGRIRLNTEYDVEGLRGRASKADEQFASFFTQHYSNIAERHPVYQELFEYAKMVALAKYLKEKRIPLHWLLLANKDLVITEDSPGTVDQLAKGSDHFRGMTIMGGVDLKPNSHYVYDEEAVAAIQEAMSRMPSVPIRTAELATGKRTVRRSPGRFSFDVGEQSYSVVPQHTLTSGKDHRGIRYQTDLALCQDGRPGLELVRYYNPQNREGGEFGKGWYLLVPYRVRPVDDAKREFLNAVIPRRMAVENLCTGDREVLSFSEDRYSAAGYVPDKLESSQVVGLFLMSNASYRLADKLGNQFHFNQAGYLTDMFLSPSGDHHVHIEYADDFTAAFTKTPYVVRPAGNEKVPFLNAMVPKQVRVTDLVHGDSEVLNFNDKNRIPGYMPLDGKASRYRLLAILSNAGLQLIDKHGNQTVFDPGWRFRRMLPSRERCIVRSVSMGGQKATFGYTINGSGEVIIASSSLSANKPDAPVTHIVRYEHDDEGRLCRVRHSKSSGSLSRRAPRDHLAMVGEQ